MMEQILTYLLVASACVNVYMFVKRPHKHIKVYPVKGMPKVFAHKFKTKKSRSR